MRRRHNHDLPPVERLDDPDRDLNVALKLRSTIALASAFNARDHVADYQALGDEVIPTLAKPAQRAFRKR